MEGVMEGVKVEGRLTKALRFADDQTSAGREPEGSTENNGSTKQIFRVVQYENKHQKDKDYENKQYKKTTVNRWKGIGTS